MSVVMLCRGATVSSNFIDYKIIRERYFCWLGTISSVGSFVASKHFQIEMFVDERPQANFGSTLVEKIFLAANPGLNSKTFYGRN